MNENHTENARAGYTERQTKTPLFHGVKEHAEKEVNQFHIPGHKRGQGMDPEFADFIGYNALSIDQINIAPLDDLHHPHGIIDEAQKLAAEAFGADHTFFSVQGTSGAIMTMIMTVCHPGDKIIVPRNVHKSIMSAIVFSGAKPIFIHPELDDELGISHGITVHSVERALRAHPDTKGLLVINPTYFGVSANLAEIVRISHLYDVPVMVDEAHGVHIHFSDDMPDSAMQAGADMAATSVHKLGGSLTQSSVLNIQGSRIKPERVQTIISMLTTTSTSYILLASLDTARRYLAISGEEELRSIIKLSHDARKRLNEIEGVHCPGAEIIDHRARFDIDPSKLIISVKDLNVNGYEAEIWLREHANLEVELSDLYNILCIITLGDNTDTVDTLVKAIRDMAEFFQQSQSNTRQLHQVQIPNIPTLSLSPREAFYAETEVVALENAAGRISAEFIMIYPPGIPIFIPGEIIEEDNIAYIFRNMDAGLPVQGTEDPTVRTIRVIQERRAIY
ncbi:aminotransferase class I/II-fold pyridoxal phosphate-dependent enzyme [Salisediminibacterium selenitireducens]|uniref:Orn/Lys/Arg decarboxylase major region n=1 Tax=Bacillus selenitireducens (strain ATCC 700615 / DSM 15326 / MLS10) TaxID=439292 RepID=D6XTI4_BACIE|nr:aminotransferase class I/II-fold pyridoxal phosphate-dependent enzyme [Salisediminibacterium selenitireducens]ADH99120.1 Orn/Lys/Arg decarboxylase major region [[Bacillus] selenitireducens MLS10]